MSWDTHTHTHTQHTHTHTTTHTRTTTHTHTHTRTLTPHTHTHTHTHTHSRQTKGLWKPVCNPIKFFCCYESYPTVPAVLCVWCVYLCVCCYATCKSLCWPELSFSISSVILSATIRLSSIHFTHSFNLFLSKLPLLNEEMTSCMAQTFLKTLIIGLLFCSHH